GGYENQVLSELLKWMGRKRETKHGWNSLLTNSTSKKELTRKTVCPFSPIARRPFTVLPPDKIRR
ncbi:MAG: hypothetical protein LBF89_07740, partial [Bacteroidales bacterium]|nr:hypothetical protein [Bacteroidales bacterium]